MYSHPILTSKSCKRPSEMDCYGPAESSFANTKIHDCHLVRNLELAELHVLNSDEDGDHTHKSGIALAQTILIGLSLPLLSLSMNLPYFRFRIKSADQTGMTVLGIQIPFLAFPVVGFLRSL